MSLISLLIYLVIIGLIFYVVWWGVGQINPPEPIRKVIQVVLVLVVVVVLVSLLMNLGGISMPQLK